MRERSCAVNGCEGVAGRPGTGRGMCSKHYQRWKRTGDVGSDVNNCVCCGADISHRRADARYCSGACTQRHRYQQDPQAIKERNQRWVRQNSAAIRDNKREYMRRRRAAARAALGPRSCAYCGADISHRDASTRYCTELCGNRGRRAVQPPRPSRHCEACGADISHRGGKAKYCSTRCAQQVRYQQDSAVVLAAGKRSRRRIRDTVFAHFGTSCVQCGSTEELHLDHVNQDGREHRALLSSRGIYPSGGHFYRHLIAVNFDTDGYELQVLCGPCNRRKAAAVKRSENTQPASE